MSTADILKSKYSSTPHAQVDHKKQLAEMLASAPKHIGEERPSLLTETPHSLYRLTSKLCNTPHLMEQSAFSDVMSYLDSRNVGDFKLSEATPSKAPSINYNQSARTGVIAIDGPLTYKPTGFEALCGGTSYQSIKEQFNALAAAGARRIVLQIDSPGGEAYGMTELGRYLRSEADKRNIKLIAYADGLAASAAYGLAVAAHEVVANPASTVGSIGVVVRLMNDSKMLEKKGISRTFVYAGTQKVAYNADGEFSSSFLADIQGKVDALYAEFSGYVSSMRKLPVFSIKNTEARTYFASEALRLRLVDKILTHAEFEAYLQTAH